VTLSSTSTTGTSICTFTSSTMGSYSVNVIGTGGSPSVSHSVTYTVTVGKANPTISTTLSSSTVVVGNSVTDSAALTGATSNARGTVTYEFFTGSA
jgi:hypothetical protein